MLHLLLISDCVSDITITKQIKETNMTLVIGIIVLLLL